MQMHCEVQINYTSFQMNLHKQRKLLCFHHPSAFDIILFNWQTDVDMY